MKLEKSFGRIRRFVRRNAGPGAGPGAWPSSVYIYCMAPYQLRVRQVVFQLEYLVGSWLDSCLRRDKLVGCTSLPLLKPGFEAGFS